MADYHLQVRPGRDAWLIAAMAAVLVDEGLVDLEWLEDFVALAESGNFSRAAEARAIAQPALSRHMRSLEEWVGTELVDRSAHPGAPGAYNQDVVTGFHQQWTLSDEPASGARTD